MQRRASSRKGAGKAPVGQASRQAVQVPREFAVYQRNGMPCLRCGSTVRHKVVAGRNLFWCGGCQRRT